MIQSLTHRKATINDLSKTIDLLIEDELGKNRESKHLSQKYIEAFQKIDRDENQYLMVVENQNEIIATCHLTIIASLTFEVPQDYKLKQ